MRIALDAGHGLQTAGKRCMKAIDPNETREWYLNQRIASKVEQKLKQYDGVETLRVDDITGAKDVALSTRCKSANNFNADIYCSFHHNAAINGGSGGGLCVITYDDSKDAVALRDTLYSCLIGNGALKGNRSTSRYSDKNLYVLNSTKMIAVLVEHGFMDSTTDTPIILTDEYAEKCANGWIAFFEKYYGIKKKSAPQPKPEAPKAEGYKVKITANSLNIRSKAGTSADCKIVGSITDKGIYTIIEEQNVNEVTWGKLKSGAGWISLKYTKRV